MDERFPQRKHPRLDNYDYSAPGAYFVTICALDRRCLLSHIVGRGLAPAEIRLTQCGEIAARQLLQLEKRYPTLKVDRYVVMPNHIHAIFILNGSAGASPRPTVPDIVCAYKSITTRECKKVASIDKLFQTSFYEHIIRGQADYDGIAAYIENNPTQWELDNLYTEE